MPDEGANKKPNAKISQCINASVVHIYLMPTLHTRTISQKTAICPSFNKDNNVKLFIYKLTFKYCALLVCLVGYIL